MPDSPRVSAGRPLATASEASSPDRRAPRRPRSFVESVYLRALGLQQPPFSLASDPAAYFPSSVHDPVLDALVWGLEHDAGVLLLSGEAGTGKSLLLRRALCQVQRLGKKVLLRQHPRTPKELLRLLLFELGGNGLDKPRDQLLHEIEDHLRREALRSGGSTVLAIDNAELLGTPLLDEIRLLTDLEDRGERLVQVVLCSQPRLADLLGEVRFASLSQRLAQHLRLGALTAEDSIGYLEHRLRAAGATHPLLTRPAMERIHRGARGVPRLLNLAAEQGLMKAFGARVLPVDETMAENALGELGLSVLEPPRETLKLVHSSGRANGGESGPSEKGIRPRNDSPARKVNHPRARRAESKGGATHLSRSAMYIKVRVRLFGVELPDDVAEAIARGSNADMSELDGIVDRLLPVTTRNRTIASANVFRVIIGGRSTAEADSDNGLVSRAVSREESTA